MKHEKLLTALSAAGLAAVIALGTLGCLVSAFDLPLQNMDRLLAVCGILSIFCAGLLSFRWGSPVLAGLVALAGGYLYHDGRALAQLRVLLHRLTTIYDRAYGWGVMALPEGTETVAFVDWPLGIIGCLIVITVCVCVCRQRSAILPVLMAVLPLGACVVVTDTVPGELWLLAVMAGLILLILSGPVRRENATQGLRLTLGAALPVALGLIVLFLAAPQESYVNQAELLRENIILAVRKFPQLMENGVTELTARLQPEPPKQLNLSTLGERIAFTYPVMEVTAENSGILYLREQDYDLYDGLGWTASPDREETFSAAAQTTEVISIHTQNRKEVRYLPYYPAGETLLRGGCAENPEGEREYDILRGLLPDNWRQTAYGSAAGAPEELAAYCALPEDTRQRGAAFLEGMFSENASHTEKADIIAALVTNSAVYDLAPEKMPPSETDFALWFLREGERGYCVHFATAAAVLLRCAGIPARYVTGYMLEAEAGRAVTVTEENAHAWAEYYEPGLGLWLPLEATPAEEALPPVIPETTPPTEKIQTEPTESATEEPLPTESIYEESLPEPEELPSVTAPQKEPPLWLLWLLLLPLVLAAQRWLRLTWRHRQFRKGSSNRQALRRWREAERLSRLLKECPSPELQELAQKAKFSQYELTDEELSRFDDHIHSCIRRLKGKPWWKRVLYRFLYAAY